MSLLLIDFESSGLDVQQDKIIEVGAMLCDNKFNVQEKLSMLVNPGQPVSDVITKVTGITNDMLVGESDIHEMFEELGTMVSMELTYVIAFNRAFDEQLFKAEVRRHDMTLDPKMNYLVQVPWLCAMADIEQHMEFKSWKQMHIALDHGITVNPKELHRAINDVELMRQILLASGTTPEKMYEYQTSPWLYIRAMVRKPWEDNGEGIAQAKALGYGWEQAKGDASGKRFEKCWVKRIKEKNWGAEEKAAPFPIKLIGGS